MCEVDKLDVDSAISVEFMFYNQSDTNSLWKWKFHEM
jgi:hypothetical protein